MREDFLHYIWKNNYLLNKNLRLVNGDILQIISSGEHNKLSGPDFLGAHLKIGTQEWAGNVEIHTHSSHWYAHGHEKDRAYSNIILHVVWQHDSEVFDYHNNIIPTLELQSIVSQEILDTYHDFFNRPTSFIPCEKELIHIENSVWNIWKSTLYLERLKEKSSLILKMLQDTQNDWESVFFRLMMRYFGGNINGEIFENAARKIPFTIIRKELHRIESLEALLFGQLGLLTGEALDTYQKTLQTEYQYQQHKYQLLTSEIGVQFFKLRPSNFPTIRLSQLANFYNKEKNLFAKCLSINSIEEWQTLVTSISTSEYWKTHYTFTKESKSKIKKITKLQAELLWINVIIPIQYTYAIFLNELNNSSFLTKMTNVPVEENAILNKFQNLKVVINNALESQAILQLYKKYCSKHECLRCQIGITLLKQKILPF